MKKTQTNELPWVEQCSPAAKFHSFCRNVSLALGGIANTGPWAGGHPFDVQFRRIPAGASVCPFHAHLAQWELFVVQSGSGTVRAGSEVVTIGPGDAFIHPPGEPHQLTNTSAEELIVLIVADHSPLDAFYYPDSNKWGLRPPGNYFRTVETDYFEGEEPASGATPTYRASGSPPGVPVTPFSTRRCNVEQLPWELWESPRKKFRGYSREVSIALGAKRNTPTGLGGHPFDLEIIKVLPGECPNPFHSHAAQWELFLILSGTATVRANDASHVLQSGEVCLHPPREPHQIRNASATEDLVYLLVADNPPVDYWYYPDSDKWGLREPRMFFRPTPADYYDGEE